jgi:hypothetical protein
MFIAFRPASFSERSRTCIRFAMATCSTGSFLTHRHLGLLGTGE